MWVMMRNVADITAMATAIRVRLDDRIGFTIDDLMMVESMLPKQLETMLRY
jgi:hypothetical protein